MPMSVRRIAAASLLVACILLVSITFDFAVPFIGYGLAAAFLFQVTKFPQRKFTATTLAAAGALLLFQRLLGVQRVELSFGSLLGFLGLACFLGVGPRANWAEGSERRDLMTVLTPAAVLAVFILGSQKSLGVASLVHPRTLDLYLLAADGTLGFQPSFLVGRWFRESHALYKFGEFTYLVIPLAMAAVYAGHMKRHDRTLWELIEL